MHAYIDMKVFFHFLLKSFLSALFIRVRKKLQKVTLLCIPYAMHVPC